jgi:hypothetical protein
MAYKSKKSQPLSETHGLRVGSAAFPAARVLVAPPPRCPSEPAPFAALRASSERAEGSARDETAQMPTYSPRSGQALKVGAALARPRLEPSNLKTSADPRRPMRVGVEKPQSLPFRFQPVPVSGHWSLFGFDLGLRTLYLVTCHSPLVTASTPCATFFLRASQCCMAPVLLAPDPARF